MRWGSGGINSIFLLFVSLEIKKTAAEKISDSCLV